MTFGDSAGHSPFTPHSPQAVVIAELFRNTLVLCGAVFLVVAVLVGYCAIRFRSRGDAVPAQVEGNTRLEVAWTLAPVFVLAGLLVMTVRAMAASDGPTDQAPDITVVGHQWWWEARYASGAVTANELHIPTGRALVVRLESADVTHDFWVPDLGRKMDATPGHPTTLWLEADEPGPYVGTCAEYCGVQHAWMRILVVAQSPAEYASWERRQSSPAISPAGPASGEAERGAALMRELSCLDCHAIGGVATDRPPARFAPDLTHFASRSTLGAGILANNPTNVALWLKDPEAIKPGCHMPNAQLSAEQTGAIVAYLEGLK